MTTRPNNKPPPPAVEMRNINKRFGDVVASNDVDFRLGKGQIHALLGENGAGKTTLMRILYGLYHADMGNILIHGQPTTIRSPKDAIGAGIGMVTQHFALALPLTVTENVILGHTMLAQKSPVPHPKKQGWDRTFLGRLNSFRLDLNAAHQHVAEVAQSVGIEVDPRARVRDLSVGQRQRVEILKALYRQANILILDEPTAVLAPQEADQLFENLRRLQDDGLSVIFISHKLHEVMAIAEQVTVLRAGTVVGSIATTDAEEATLARMMVGRVTHAVTKRAATNPPDGPIGAIFDAHSVAAVDNKGLGAVRGVSFQIKAGEILGIAGVSGNGQTELAQVLDGTRRATDGTVRIAGRDITNADPTTIMAHGVGRIPEDRHDSVVGEMTVAQNMALEHLGEFTRKRLGATTLDRKQMLSHAERLIADYQIKARPTDKIRTLSGGNMQKVILARVLERNPTAIIVAQPTRGLDVGATEYVRQKLVEQRDRGAAILLISEDLDEILALADRIAVMYEGEIIGELDAATATAEALGLLMAGIQDEGNSVSILKEKAIHDQD